MVTRDYIKQLKTLSKTMSVLRKVVVHDFTLVSIYGHVVVTRPGLNSLNSTLDVT